MQTATNKKTLTLNKLMPDFSQRSTQSELMDDFSMPAQDLYQNLREIERINIQLGGHGVTINGIKKYIKKHNPNSIITLADIGCGGGDTLRYIYQWANKKNVAIQLTGLDYHPVMIQYAQENSQQLPIHYHLQNVFEIEQKYDITTCSLFCHHFEDEKLILLLRKLYTITNRLILINDLHRHWFAYYSIKYLTRWLKGSYLVQNDAPLSVLRGFKKKEWRVILDKAGLKNAQIQWKWAFRHQILIWL